MRLRVRARVEFAVFYAGRLSGRGTADVADRSRRAVELVQGICKGIAAFTPVRLANDDGIPEPRQRRDVDFGSPMVAHVDVIRGGGGDAAGTDAKIRPVAAMAVRSNARPGFDRCECIAIRVALREDEM